MLEIDILRPLKMPYITKPPQLQISDIDELIKPVVFGTVTKSKKLLNSLNYLRSKKFGISKTFYKLAEFFLEMTSGSFIYSYKTKQPLDICFPTVLDIDKQRYIYTELKENHITSISQVYIANKIRSQILGNTTIKINNFNRLLISAQSTKIDSISYLLKEKEFNKLNVLLMDNKYALTMLEIARWFKGYPVYITDRLCIRLRLYPYEHWVSRTSEGLKHLLCDYSPINVTLNGIVSLLQSYYACDPILSKEFESYMLTISISKKTVKKLLFDFFHNHYLYFTSTKNTMYFMYLHMELLKMERTNKSTVNIELDQTASGIVFLYLLLRDKKMATAANLITKEKSCPYTFVMNHFENFANNYITHKAEKAMELVLNECNFTPIGTIEGDIITWSIYKSKKIVRAKFDPVSRSTSTYRLYTYESKRTPDVRTHRRNFLSYLIHSIDAAVIRFYIRKMKEDHKYIINHLHDCVIIHPNYVDDFYKLVEILYKSDDLYYMSEKLIFDQMRSSLSQGSRDQLDKIKTDYLLLCDDFKTEINFDPRNIYKFEI
jgi:hypothetical protein